jgi:site-specific recombinase XerC
VSRPPKRCFACQVNRVAWVRPRVDYCYDCLPGGPFTPPACSKCGSARHFSEGMCERCHPGGPLFLGSCRGCLAWGVYRDHSWRCWSCRWWRTHYPLGDCRYCGQNTRIGEQGACRLCMEQARLVQEPGRATDPSVANRHGQQVFFANMQFHRRKTPRLKPEPRRTPRPSGGFSPVTWRQAPLPELEPDPELVRARALSADSELIRYCKDVVADHAARHGWSKRQTNDVIRSLRLLQVLQDTPGAKINATDVLQLPRYDANIQSTLDVLDAAGMLIEDRTSNVERYFAGKTGGLPTPMKTQLDTWLAVMLNGSTSAPRQRSRDPQTARIHIMGIAPIVHAWAAAGHQSLAEITAEQVQAALPESGSRRNFAEYGLRSLFTVLKSRKLIFTNPTRGMRATPVNATVPLPLDAEAIRRALNSADPAVALAVALVAFHAVTSRQLRSLTLTDIIDGRLTLDGRDIPLASPVRVRLTAWLDHRGRTWPGSINEHLFLSRKTAPRLVPVGSQFPWKNTDLRPQARREDRILQEIHASGGDARRICDLFGLTVQAALRYALTVGHPDLERTHIPVPRTRDNQ